MNTMKRLSLFIFFLFISNSFLFGQDEKPGFEKTFLLSFHSSHLGNNGDNDIESITSPQIAYRNNLKRLNQNIQLTWGIQMNRFSLKDVNGSTDYFNSHDYILSLPVDLMYHFKSRTYIGGFLSFDIPFGVSNKAEIMGQEFSDSEFNFRFLNLHFSTGLRLGQIFNLGSYKFTAEFFFKHIGLLAFKSNDYWLYPEEARPYQFGLGIGYMF